MKALRLTGAHQAELVDVRLPPPGPGEVLLRVQACGICGSDLNAWRAVPGISFPMPPGAPGHEIWGEVLAVGDRAGKLAPGALVTGLCGAGFAQEAVVSERELVELPRDGGAAPVILGEPLACATNIVRRAHVRAGEQLAVVGFGYMAALCLQLMLPKPRCWIAFSRRESSRRLALELGAEAAYSYEDAPQDLWDSFDVVLEAGGVQQTLDYATWLTAYGGRLVIAGYHADGPRTVNMQSWNWKGIDVMNAHERDPQVYLRRLREGLRIASDHDLDLSRLITHQWPLEEAALAFSAADEHPADYVKGVIRPWW